MRRFRFQLVQISVFVSGCLFNNRPFDICEICTKNESDVQSKYYCKQCIVEGTSFTVEETLTEYLSNIYTDDMFSGELAADNTIASDYSDSICINEEKNEISDITNVQTMILAENMAAFSNDSQISDSINIGDITDNTSVLSQLLVNSSMQ